MAYADYEFYKNVYFGSAVPESDFARMAERASDWVDVMTFDRLTDGLPENASAQKRIKKAVCELAEIFEKLEQAEKKAFAAASAVDSADGTTGVIVSKSSGAESISYASPQQIGASAKEWSTIYSAAGDPEKTKELLVKTALPLLMGIRTDDGLPILYAGG